MQTLRKLPTTVPVTKVRAIRIACNSQYIRGSLPLLPGNGPATTAWPRNLDDSRATASATIEGERPEVSMVA